MAVIPSVFRPHAPVPSCLCVSTGGFLMCFENKTNFPQGCRSGYQCFVLFFFKCLPLLSIQVCNGNIFLLVQVLMYYCSTSKYLISKTYFHICPETDKSISRLMLHVYCFPLFPFIVVSGA